MADAVREDNRVEGLLAASSADLSLPLEAQINPVTGELLMVICGCALPVVVSTLIPRDDNRVPVLCAQRTDNGEPMAMHVNRAGAILAEPI